MKPTTIHFDPAGQVHCLYTEVIPLQSLGSLHLRRASVIEFDHPAQHWEVIDPEGHVRFASPSRQSCLDWEYDNLKPITTTTKTTTHEHP